MVGDQRLVDHPMLDDLETVSRPVHDVVDLPVRHVGRIGQSVRAFVRYGPVLLQQVNHLGIGQRIEVPRQDHRCRLVAVDVHEAVGLGVALLRCTIEMDADDDDLLTRIAELNSRRQPGPGFRSLW